MLTKASYLLVASLGLSLGCSTAEMEDETQGEEYWDFDDQADIARVASAQFDCNSLDYGIYWFGPGNVSQKAVPGVANPYYNPDRPTLIHAHGWQPNSVKNGLRETFNYGNVGKNINAADAWVNAGWNVGIFYWNQFADEGEVKDAEAKIWSATGPRGMRWRRCDNSHTTEGAPARSVGELFYDAYVSALADYRGPGVRLSGHSLGAQVAGRLAYLAKEGVDAGQIPASLLPNRVALLDPFWSRGGKSFLGNRWTGEVARDQIAALIGDGVVFERYKTSNINDFFVGDSNGPLTNRIGETELIAGWIGALDQSGRHRVAPFLYLYGFGFNPPVGCITDVCDDVGPSAAASDAQMREYMDSAYRWLQSSGRDTERPTDDIIRVRR